MTRRELFLDELAPGQIYESDRQIVTTEAILAFAREFDPQPFHTDPIAARDTFFQGLAASGWHTAAMTMRLILDGAFTPHGGIIGGGSEQLSWPRPVRPGDELRVICEVVEVRPSRSKPGQGIAKVRCTTFNQHDDPVQIFVANLVVFRRPGDGQP
jgi:acyl dehydratase